jgi:hypothetical protein
MIFAGLYKDEIGNGVRRSSHPGQDEKFREAGLPATMSPGAGQVLPSGGPA